jgi:hypothetical protein
MIFFEESQIKDKLIPMGAPRHRTQKGFKKTTLACGKFKFLITVHSHFLGKKNQNDMKMGPS